MLQEERPGSLLRSSWAFEKLGSTLLRNPLVIRTLSAKQMFNQCLRSSFRLAPGSCRAPFKTFGWMVKGDFSWEYSHPWKHLCPQSRGESCS